MLSRTASNLYWIGRYMERAEFTTRLVEATIRLSALSGGAQADQAWRSALAVTGEAASFARSIENFSPFAVSRYLTLAEENPNSVRAYLGAARDNARAARNALTREAWEAVNRAWQSVRDRSSPGGGQATLNLVEAIKAETRGFEGAVARMLRREAYWFMRLGSVIERGDNTARLLDVKYYLLLPQGEQIGGALDRDQWTTILHTVSARTAYRHIYQDALKPWLVADLLIFKRELPRSLVACAAETIELLADLGELTGRQGEADRLARQRERYLLDTDIDGVFRKGLHQYLNGFINDNAALGQAIAAQFRFG
ncbi:alpha-E domain-containing protein [Sphingosinicella rhizophila]|uniref:Alpha-E domain-containing protein n=1 Tax=Sphingosinicella rhizophila TaxID=3050082 RepID=A0ABU3Q3H8_9SPHN|nr:alpha-E domain-containing protein [Sphingosinicella sp. GR2756]MDT9597967.1 alpha-E domain-containing protein [Sphingosinicella sp. GR2756]